MPIQKNYKYIGLYNPQYKFVFKCILDYKKPQYIFKKFILRLCTTQCNIYLK